MVNGIHKSVFTILLLSIVGFFSGSDVIASPEKISVSNSLHFIENKGQIKDQYGNTRRDADFKLSAGMMSVFVGSGHMHYQWNKHKKSDGLDVIESYRLDVTLEGANTFISPEPGQRTGFYERYYTGNLNGVSAYSYDKITYKNVYNNIDWVLYVQDGGLKYDFIVHPGGKVNDIKIHYDGATNVVLDNGDITVTTPYGSVTEKAPYTYGLHSKEPIVSSYILEGNNLSFDVGVTGEPVVIDPSLEWATYMGGGAQDFGMCAASDTAGNVYMGGRTASAASGNVFTSTAHQVTFGGDEDGVVTRYTAGGVRQWSTYYGGNEKDAIHSITVDIENNIVFAGVTDSSVTGIATTNGHKPTYCGGPNDAFLVKMDITGKRLWATYYGGAGKERDLNDYQVGVACDTQKNIFLTGITESDTGIATTTTGIQQTARAGKYDGFIAKFDKAGTRLWGTYYGGVDDDQFTNVNVDSNGTPYVVGKFESSGMGTSNTHMPTKPGAGSSKLDILIAKFNPHTGARTWATYYGGNAEEQSRGIVVGDTNYVYICGSTLSTSGIASSTNAAQSSIGGAFDMFLAKFDSTGKRIWSTYFGGSGTDHGGNVVIDHKGNLNIAGITASSSGISTSDAFRLNLNLGDNTVSSFDALIAIYNPSGQKVWSTYYGGVKNDYGFGVARGKSYGHIYITGNSESSTGVSYNGSQNKLGGDNDAFMVKITPDTSVSIGKETVDDVYCEQDTFTMRYYTTERFRAGNVFTVQLSDASGNFTNPKNIGSAASVGLDSGDIFIQLPPNVSGTKFRIRVVGTAPIDTSYDNEFDINIKPLPTWPVASNNGPTCSNDTLRLNSTTSSTGVAYSWVGPDNYSANVQNATRMYMTASIHTGDYIVTADLNGCARKDTTTVVIKQAADKPVLTSNGTLCTGDSLVLTATTTSTGHSTDWRHIDGTWNALGMPGGTSLRIARYNVKLTDAGRYVVSLTQNGCESKDTVNVSVAERPQPVTATSGSTNICQHDTLFLYANCPTSDVTYNWSGPGVTRSNEQNPVLSELQPANSGNYIVSADKNGCASKDTIKNVIIRKTPPQPTGASNSPLCTDEDLEFSVTGISGSSGARALWMQLPVTAVSWKQYAVGPVTQRPKAQLSEAGRYVVKSENQPDNGCSLYDTVTVNITLSNYFPGVNAVIDKGSAVCPTDTIQFSISPPQAGLTYTWTGPGMFIPNGNVEKPKVENIKYSDSGFYYVRGIGPACASFLDTVHLAVVDTLSPPVLTLPPFDCTGDTMRVGATHPYIQLLTLEYPGGVLSGAAFTFNDLTVANNQGRYILGVKSGGCKNADTAYLNDIRPTPVKPVVVTNTPVCEDKTLTLKSTSSTAGSSYIWSGPAGFTAAIQSPSVDNVSPGIHSGYYVSKAVLNGCTSAADSQLVIVNANPVPEITSKDVFCEGATITLSGRTQQNESYGWANTSGFKQEGAVANIQNAMLNHAGIYTLTATSTITGCQGTTNVNVKITPLPGKPEATYKEPLCEGDKMELSLTDTSTGPIDYIWRGPGGFSFSEKDAFVNEVTFADSGMYVVTASRLGCTITDTIYVRVRPRPIKPIISTNSPITAGDALELYINNPVTGATFKWKGPLNFASLAQNPIIDKAKSTGSGTYTVVTTLDGCSSSAFTIVTVEKGIGDLDELVLFPNPNTGNFTIRAKLSYDQILPYEVLSTLGTVVYSDIAQSEDKKIERNIEIDGKLASGYYIFRIMMSGKSVEIPFSIVR